MADVAVIGAGAIGGSIGALLHRVGHRVILTARGAQLDAIRAHGLQISGALGSFTARMEVQETLSRRPEIALLAVKTQDLSEAIRQNRDYLTDVPVVTLQNGVRADDIAADLLPQEHIVSAVVLLAANYLTAGTISIESPGALVIGHAVEPVNDLVPVVAPVLRSAIETVATDNIRGAHWLKLMLNLNNALPAATNMPLEAIYADPRLRRLAVLLIREGADAVRRAGISLAALPGFPLLLLRLVTLLPTTLAGRLAAGRIRRAAASSKSKDALVGSTLQSLRRGRPTEIDYLNGEVVRLGRETGSAAPLNETVVRIVHDIEKGGSYRSAEALLAEVSQPTDAD